MPIPEMDRLNGDSTHQQIQDAISAEIASCMKEPPPPGAESHQKYCSGKAYGMARDKTGKDLSYG